jgi:hypothetical protein
MLVGGISYALGNELKFPVGSNRFHIGLYSDGHTRIQGRAGCQRWTDPLREKISELGLMRRCTLGFKDGSIPDTSNYGNTDATIGAIGFCLSQNFGRQSHSFSLRRLMFREQYPADDIAGFTRCRSMMVTIFFLSSDSGLPRIIRTEWDNIGPRPDIYRGGLPAVLQRLIEDQSDIAVGAKCQRFIYLMRCENPGPLGHFELLLRCSGALFCSNGGQSSITRGALHLMILLRRYARISDDHSYTDDFQQKSSPMYAREAATPIPESVPASFHREIMPIKSACSMF